MANIASAQLRLVEKDMSRVSYENVLWKWDGGVQTSLRDVLVQVMPIVHRYENEGRGRKTIKAQQLWAAVIEAQVETGTPYMVYKDHCNRKSNQQNLGTIKCSNLCTEIVEYSSPDEVGYCLGLMS